MAKRPPRPEAGFLGLRLTRELRDRPLETLSRLAAEHGPVYQTRLGPFLAFFINEPELIEEVLVRQSTRFEKWRRQMDIFRPLDGEGLVVSEGPFWLRQRRLVQPAFRQERMPGYAAIVTARAERALDAWLAAGEVDLVRETNELTLAVIARALFDVELDADLDTIRRATHELSAILTAEFSRPLPLPDWFPSPEKRRKRAAIKALRGLIAGIIAERRASGEDKGDLLSMLLLAVDEEGDGGRMTDRQALDEALTLFNAGHDTTAAGLTWVFELLARHPDAQSAARREVVGALGDRAPSLEDLPRLPLTARIVKEALRLYPPAWALFARRALGDVALGSWTLPRGALVFIYPWVVHRDPRFFPDPDRFDPDRFLPEREARRPRFAYLPFGGGGHLCIGRGFALMEMRLILARALQRAVFAPGSEPELELEALLALRPRGGRRVRVRPA